MNKNQAGATLFTALIFLITLAIIGANAAKLATLEERMAGNSRNRDLAFQAAEATLNYAKNNLHKGEKLADSPLLTKQIVATDAGKVIAPGLKYFDACAANSVEFWNGTGAPDCKYVTGGSTELTKYNWIGLKSSNAATATARIPIVTLNQVAEPPMYVVERYMDETYTDPVTSLSKSLEKFRITARAVGGDKNAVVILQAIYTYKQP
jgi:type IV pilus assembly protein PilX